MELITKINWVDIVVVILMFRMSYVSLRDGLSHEIFPFFGSILILVMAMRYYTVFGSLISRSIMNMPAELSNFLSFLVLVVVSGLLVKLIRVVLDKIMKVQWHPIIEKFGGLAVGVMKAYVITCIVLTTLALMPLSHLQWSIKDKSLTGKYILRTGPEICERVGIFLPEVKAGEVRKAAIPKKPANR